MTDSYHVIASEAKQSPGAERKIVERGTMETPTVFISYSHRDEEWKDRLQPHLEMLEVQNQIELWHDRMIDGGANWFPEITEAMKRAAVAVCLISPYYLASKFVNQEEIPYLLQRRETDGMLLLPVLVEPCLWDEIEWLKPIQMLPGDGKSIAVDFQGKENVAFTEVAKRVYKKIEDPTFKISAPSPDSSPPKQVDIGRLPVTGAELFGRQGEMAMLDDAWETDNTNVVSLVAWGGVGKSTLVNKWLGRMDADNYRGARRVYAWSFYSQGTGERVTSADQFIAAALEWFGDPDPTAGSPWNKGERLADLVKQERSLLILDGLEPLQSAQDYEKGKVNDPALGILITELARENPGLCVITTRVDVPDLMDSETTQQKNLEQISDEAGRALLRVSGVQGNDAQLESATRDFGNHALALNLLAAYLHEIKGHSISHASQIPDLDISVEEGKHPCRVIAAFEKRFGVSPEVELLRMLGLFDRPADKDSIDALRAEPAIPDLTEHIHGLGEVEWLRLLHELRSVKLIAPESEHNPDVLDAHPLVREHFGRQLRGQYPDAWREGNNRLYEHLKATAKELPDTIEEMAPLFAAVAHGCQAGRHQEALLEVYGQRILRRNEHFSWRKLGTSGADLSALSGFFDPPWSQPVAGLTEDAKALVLHQAGLYLQALSRLAEAAQPMQAGLDTYIAAENWKAAAITANNISRVHLTIGDVSQALDYVRQSVELADRSGDAFQRIARRATLADALHQSGQLQESEASFREAEEMQKEFQPECPLLYSLPGFQYCDLLLGQGKYQEVQNRAGQTLEWGAEEYSLLDFALEHLSLGRAHLLQAQAEGTGDFTRAADELAQAVDGLRKAGHQQELPRGLLSRAELHRVCNDYEHAQRDLDEAMTIATRGGMGLHEADCHLGYARLYLAMDNKEKARENLGIAKEMIDEMGYHRRDGEVAALEKQLLD